MPSVTADKRSVMCSVLIVYLHVVIDFSMLPGDGRSSTVSVATATLKNVLPNGKSTEAVNKHTMEWLTLTWCSELEC